MPEAGADADQLRGGSAEEPGTMSGYGVASAVLAVLAVAAIVLIAVVWSGRRAADTDRDYQARVLQAAAQWTEILINMNTTNVENSMMRLRDGTAGELNTGFESAIAPYREVVKTLRSQTTGQVESVSIEVAHHELDRQQGHRPAVPASLPPELAARTDTVLVVATSVSENASTDAKAPSPGAPPGPTTVRWNLRLGVSDIDGTPKVSRLESLR